MRSLKTEELELVAGGIAGGIPAPSSTKNNGLGNGDQGAPGNSRDHNCAENNGSVNSTGNPPGSGKFLVIPN